MTLLGIDGVSSQQDPGQNSYKDRHPLHHHRDLPSRGSRSLIGSDILPRPYQDNSASRDTATALPHDRIVANSVRPSYVPLSHAAPKRCSSSNPMAFTSPAGSGSAGSMQVHTSSPRRVLGPASEDAQAAIRRQRNTMAARKYRQKRLDHISFLEETVDKVTGERNELKLQLARREAEVDALREMLSKK
ncbi:hypothetical protein E4U41_003814 [Claviceps citrina]|nr:hypothetical protein E4U41_003814 [Claviceps citrina]